MAAGLERRISGSGLGHSSGKANQGDEVVALDSGEFAQW
jgi:hypothetical protein